MNCYTNCSLLDIRTCLPHLKAEQEVKEGKSPSVSVSLRQSPSVSVMTPLSPPCVVDYDEAGCYDPLEYMAIVNQENNFEAYSALIGYIMLGLGSVGIIGNLLSIVVLLNKERICFNYILMALNCSDTLHIIFAILDVVKNNHGDSYPNFFTIIFPYFHYPLYRYKKPPHPLVTFFSD